MNTDNRDINTADTHDGSIPVGITVSPGETDSLGRWFTWGSLALAIVSYAILLLWNGVFAMCVSAVATVLGFCGVWRTRGTLRRVAVTAVIAAAVLLVVVGAFVVVIQLGLK